MTERLPGRPSRAPVVGDLLVASPVLGEPFTRTVILLLDHDESGTLGVVVNRPTEMTAASILPGWADLLGVEQRLFQGGPVAMDSALALAVIRGRAEPPGFRPVLEAMPVPQGPPIGVGVVDLDGDPQEVGRHVAAFRVMAGYAGWSPGQLADELREGSWAVVRLGDPVADVFDGPRSGADFWSAVLRRQAGTLPWWARAPRDPTMN